MKRFLVLAACMVLLSGCTQSNIVQPDSETKIADPNFEVQNDIEIDWTQVDTDADSIFEDESTYPYSREFHFYLEPNKKDIMLVWVVADDFPISEIKSYTEEMIRGFNDVVATQDFSIEKSAENFNGGLWKEYGISFGIAPESTQDDEETWFVSGNFLAGEEFVIPDTKELEKSLAEEGSAEPVEPAPDPVAAETESPKEAAE